jgi:hypothetical protein
MVSTGWLMRRSVAKVEADFTGEINSERRWRIAIHEAGHCVAARLMGLPVVAASVAPDDAYAAFPDDLGAPSMVALMAGAVAEGLVLGDYDGHGVSDDCARWTLLMDEAGDDDALWAFVADLLLPHEASIIRLAAALMDAQTLDQGEIDALLSQ